MRLYRIFHDEYRMEPWSGAGSLYSSGRWHDNRFGLRIVYAATSPALACVEQLVRLERDRVPTNYLLGEAELDDRLVDRQYRQLSLEQIKARRARLNRTQAEGMEWLRSRHSPALCVPSFSVLYDWNVLLNPAHPETVGVRFLPSRPFSFDSRLFRLAEKIGASRNCRIGALR